MRKPKTTGSTPTNSVATSTPTSIPNPGRSPSNSDERLAYIALAIVPGLGGRGLAALLSQFGSACAIIEAIRRPRGQGDTLTAKTRSMLANVSLPAAEAFLVNSAAHDVVLATPADPQYPARLRSIPDPPPVLFLGGNLALLERRAVAIVGSRMHSDYGREIAHNVSAMAAAAGICVVSGMARGLDAVAHEAALEVGGGTIGVLGNGIGVVYPAANAELYRRVAEHGLFVTEHPPGERAQHAGAFPRRNRLISGLAEVLVVIEAAKGSGTMLTVASALEQGRDVMAVPGPVTSTTSEGTNQLLRDGAEPLLHPEELLDRFNLTAPQATPIDVPADPPPCTLSPTEAVVFDALSAEGRHIDELAITVGLPVGQVLGVLCGLELAGLVDQLPGTIFRRVYRRW